jgi:lipoprotein-releasing system permease protein
VSYVDITPITKPFTVIDDCSTDVASIDSECVYVEFATLQALNNMSAESAADDPHTIVERNRCSQIHVKVRPDWSEGYKLQEVARQIDGVWQEFKQAHPDAGRTPIIVETWRQRQSRLVSPIEAQRTLMAIVLGIISLVAVVLIFVILYVIVMQKTRDIGVLKAVGASNSGVAGIFLAYGAAIALVGSIVGIIGGCLFVHNINPIHDWIGRTFGFVVWSRETFMFEKIPNEVQFFSAAMIFVGAVVFGILGAAIPAIKAARKQPVEALRYE